MRNRARALLLPALLGLVAPAGAEPDAAAWLSRADVAAGSSNFIGTMILYKNGAKRTMRIEQGFDGEHIHQRLVALSGEKCEILRRKSESSVVFPGRRLVIHGYQRAKNLIPKLRQDVEELSRHYRLETRGREEIAGRVCQLIVAAPRDRYRYGCEFCVDLASGLPLRVRMMTPTGERVERFAFTSLIVLDSIRHFAPGSFRLETDTHGFGTVGVPYGAEQAPHKWQVGRMPPGFEERLAVLRRLPRSPEPVYHMVLADALSRISIFIRPLPEGGEFASREFARKAHNGYVTQRNGHKVTVIGGVPAETLRLIGNSLNLQR